ncbi:IS110 family transposase [Falsiroseomonas sp. E2-1-a20]|uniref:IS110 family transposase n=1 Tax=Falsiroseomonas sp. E2-1-a20 TaxID=3239300 RepID=UPI003F337844
MERISVGIDIAKDIHWVTAIDANGAVRIDRKLPNTPPEIAGLAEQLAALGGAVQIGIDVIGGIASLAEVMLAEAGFTLVHVPGLAVNRARQRTVGGENKSDPRDARTIAEQVRTRSDLRRVEPFTEIDIEIRLLAGRRRDLVHAQTQRLARMHDLLVGIFPGLEARLDLTTKGPLHLLTKFVTPAELRNAGRKRLVRHLQAAGGLPNVEALADRALAAAAEQAIAVPAERMTARMIRELAAEALACRSRLIELDRELEALLERHPDATLIRSLPGMGVVLCAELIAEAGNLSRFRSADALASAAGMAPVLRQSGRTRFLRRPNGGNKGLKRVFYQSAFCSLSHADSRAFYDRKRREGKRHHTAVIALARRRVNVLWAVVQSRTPFQTGFKTAS